MEALEAYENNIGQAKKKVNCIYTCLAQNRTVTVMKSINYPTPSKHTFAKSPRRNSPYPKEV